MEWTFATTAPVELSVDIGSGSVLVDGTETTTAAVTVDGAAGAVEATRVEFDGRRLRVIGPKGLHLLRDAAIDVRVSVPTDSGVAVRAGSAGVTLTGRLGDATLRTGSGDLIAAGLSGHGTLQTGSGSVAVGVAGSVDATSGSGDVEVREIVGASKVRSGSGTVVVDRAGGDLVATTGSGNVRLGLHGPGRVRVRAGSGNVAIAVAEGLPLWTDIHSAGGVRSSLSGRGEPAPGTAYVDLGVVVGSGRVTLADA